jgi:hypothetical protein
MVIANSVIVPLAISNIIISIARRKTLPIANSG